MRSRPGTGSVEDALWRTLSLDGANLEQPAPEELQQQYHHFRCFLDGRPEGSLEELITGTLDQFLDEEGVERRLSKEFMPYARQLLYRYRKRRFAATQGDERIFGA